MNTRNFSTGNKFGSRKKKNSKKISEHCEQVAFFEWVSLKAKSDKRYLNIYAIPNGARTSISVAKRLKAEGLMAGVLDVNVDWPMGGFNGLRIELKIKPNKLSENQKDWMNRYNEAGYKAIVCWSADEMIRETEKYLK